MAAVASIQKLVNIPETLPACDPLEWPDGQFGYDTRPRFIDSLTNEACLVDTVSAITAIKAGPDDEVKPELGLVAANCHSMLLT